MGGGRLALFSQRRKCRRCCAFLESDMVLVVQVRSSVTCTPRNLVLLTLWSVGGWVNGVRPPEVHHNLLCLLHIEGQIVSATPFSQLCHFLSVVCFLLRFNLMMWLELNFSLFMSCCGIIVLNAKLKSMNSILT